MKRLTLCLLGALLLSSTAARADGSLASALPADTVLYMKVSNIEALVSKIKASPFYNLKDDKDVAPLIQQIEAGWGEAQREAKDEVGIDLGAFLGSIRGEVSISIGDISKLATAVGQGLSTFEEPEITPEMIPFLLAVDTGAGQAEFQKNFSTLLSSGRQAGVPIKEESFQGGKLTTISRPEGEDDGPEGVYIAQHGSKYLLSFSKSHLQAAVSRLGKTATAGLAAEGVFKSSLAKVKGDGDFLFFVNLKSFTKAVDSALSTTMFAFFWQKAQQLLIGQSLNSMTISGSLEKDAIVQRAYINNGGAADGVLGWFKTPAIPAKPSGLIPAEAGTFSSSGVNAGQIIKAIKEIAQTAMAFQGVAQDVDTLFEQNMGMKLSDIERALGNRLHTFQTAGADSSNPIGDMCMIFELNDDAPFKNLIEKVALMSGGALSPEKYLNRDIYSIDAGPGVSPAIVASDKLFIFSMSKGNAEKVVRRIGKDSSELADSPAFKKYAGLYPSKVNSLSFANEEFIASVLSGVAEMMEFSAPPDVPPGFFKLIGLVGKKFGAGVSYSVWDSTGMYAESRTLLRD